MHSQITNGLCEGTDIFGIRYILGFSLQKVLTLNFRLV